jgi:uncharacterized membrane protein YfcA
MEGQAALMLFGAGLAGGVVTAIVGGASLITFPALLAAGLPAIVANASNSVALTPANFIAGLADLKRLPPWDRSLGGLIVIAVAGSVAGALLLLVTPEKAFTAIIPLLIGMATILFAVSGPIRLWLAARPGGRAGADRSSAGLGMLLFAPVAVYGGYFGAGIGIMMLAGLGVVGFTAIHRMIALRNYYAILINGIAAGYFILFGAVRWSDAAVLTAGQIIGSTAGARIARGLPPATVRWIVVGIGLAMALALLGNAV